MTPDSKSVRHWYIQKPISHNVPLRENGAVFQQFAPTVVQSNCEWVKVWSSEDLSKYFGMGVTRWVDVMDELARLRASEERFSLIHKELMKRWDDLGKYKDDDFGEVQEQMEILREAIEQHEKGKGG